MRISYRGGFSDRNNLINFNKEIQYETLDNRTRRNIIIYFLDILNRLNPYPDQSKISSNSDKDIVYNLLLRRLYQKPVSLDQYYTNYSSMNKKFEDDIRSASMGEVFDMIECLIDILKDMGDIMQDKGVNIKKLYGEAVDTFNYVFKKEYVGYRIIDNIIVPITNEIEIEAIKEKVDIPYKEVKEHLNKALIFLSDREAPDYKNSIKESISSVEAMTKILVKNEKATLNKALNKLEKRGVDIHPQLKKAFINLYGYTSDESGIRHSGKIGGKDTTFEEAKFMLVACSAFNNYLLDNSK